jgi:hypothetical protein
MRIKIVRVNDEAKTMVIDWGWITLNHRIPSSIIANPDMSDEDMLKEIRRFEPVHLKEQAAVGRLNRLATNPDTSLEQMYYSDGAILRNAEVITDDQVENKEF